MTLRGWGMIPVPGAPSSARILILHSSFYILHCFHMDEPIIDLQSDAHFMGEALRQAACFAGVEGLF
jgi:hypothetical protein